MFCLKEFHSRLLLKVAAEIRESVRMRLFPGHGCPALSSRVH